MKGFIGINWFWWLLGLVAVVVMGGCAGSNPIMQPLTGDNVVAITDKMTDRMSVSGAVEQTRLVEGRKSIVAEAEARKAEAEARKVEAINNPKPQININDAASMAAYKDAQFAEAMKASMSMAENTVKYMADAMKAMAGDKGQLALFLKDYKLPKGVIAESFDSFFDGTAKVVEKPAILTGTAILTTAAAISKAKANITNTNSGAGNQNTGEGNHQENGIGEGALEGIIGALAGEEAASTTTTTE